MSQPHCCVLVFLALSFTSPALAEEGKASEQELAAQFTRAVAAEDGKSVSAFITAFPNVLQLRDAARAFTARASDAGAVAFLKKVPLQTDRSRAGRAEQLTALIGLALLAGKHDTISFLRANIVDRHSPQSRNALLAISFLPPRDARMVAEEIVTDARQPWQTQIECLFLLRAVGDQGTLEKLEGARESPNVSEVWKRTSWFIRQRLSLKDAAERDRWARQELVLLQMSRWDPNFRGAHTELAWIAEQVHRSEPDIAVGLLRARLSLERPRAYVLDYNIPHEIPLAAALAGIQKNTELLPLLDEWAATDYGYISQACGAAAAQLRGRKKDAAPNCIPRKGARSG
jgi:hypothetical protein